MPKEELERAVKELILGNALVTGNPQPGETWGIRGDLQELR